MRETAPVRSAARTASTVTSVPSAITPAAVTASDSPGGTAGQKKVLYYRNPMGLPDTSPVPKKDSMGMDYLPVYEGEGEDGPAATAATATLARESRVES